MPFPYPTAGQVEERRESVGAGRFRVRLIWKMDAGTTEVVYRLSDPLVGVLDRVVCRGPGGVAQYTARLFDTLGVDVWLDGVVNVSGAPSEKRIAKLLDGADRPCPVVVCGGHWLRVTSSTSGLAGVLDLYCWTDIAKALEGRAVA